jgi:ketosteroid isomerase-like protein
VAELCFEEGNSDMTEEQAQVLHLGRQWADAESRGDADALGALLADDFVLVGPLGFLLDKQQYLGSRRSGDLKHASFAWEDARIRLYGDAAVAIGSQTQRTTFQGRDASGRFRVTQIAARLDGRWKLVGLHLSPIAQSRSSEMIQEEGEHS